MVNFKFFKPLVLLAFLIPIHARTKTAQKIFPMISESPVMETRIIPLLSITMATFLNVPPETLPRLIGKAS